jgi:hypothetical protein
MGHKLDGGQVELDNNTVERASRLIALGRKIYLFAGSTACSSQADSIR